MSRVFFLIPAHNEIKSKEKLVTGTKRLCPESKVRIIDNNSLEDTTESAPKSGAIVLHEWKQGKGQATKSGFNYISEFGYDVVIIMDADFTYDPKYALKLINYSASGGYSVILGSKLKGKREEGTLTTFNTIGNCI